MSNFENHLSEKDLTTLNKWVAFYDDLIAQKYINLGKNEKDFLMDLIEDDTSKWNLNQSEICELVKLFDKSTLEFRDTILNYDTIFIFQGRSNWGVLYSNYPDPILVGIRENGDTTEISELKLEGKSVKEQIEYEMKKGYREMLHESNFLQALEEVNSKDKNIIHYINSKKQVGLFSPKMLAAGAIEYNLEKKKGLIKRTLVVSMFIDYIKINYTC